MLFNGMKKLKASAALIILGLASSIYAEDFRVALPGQLLDDDYEKENLDLMPEGRSGEKSSYVMGERDEPQFTDKQEKPFSVPGQALSESLLEEEPSEKEELLSTGYKAPHTLDNEKNLISFDSNKIYDNFYDDGETSFSFSYIRDEYKVKDSRGVFQQSYIDAEDARRGGYLHFNFDNYIYRSFLSLFYGAGLGVSFSEGEGVFSESTTTKSNVTFQLFTIPVDFRLGMTLGRGKYFKFSVSGGPSVMGISQSRDDKDRGEDEKHRRQYSFGYFGHAKAQISLSSMFDDIAFGGFSQYQMTNMYLNIEARHHSYSNFQDDISITGTSFGIGFTFEYL